MSDDHEIVNGVEWRSHGGYRWIWSEVGRTFVHVTCPFCGATVEAFLWSLAGSGKRCACGAVVGQKYGRRKVKG